MESHTAIAADNSGSGIFAAQLILYFVRVALNWIKHKWRNNATSLRIGRMKKVMMIA